MAIIETSVHASPYLERGRESLKGMSNESILVKAFKGLKHTLQVRLGRLQSYKKKPAECKYVSFWTLGNKAAAQIVSTPAPGSERPWQRLDSRSSCQKGSCRRCEVLNKMVLRQTRCGSRARTRFKHTALLVLHLPELSYPATTRPTP